ncbi:Cell cycle checkpoint control protein RAD9A [Trichinella spiralis]|uniref:Cell cycle checkpoint control protein RAD9A n=1 Tax=Trichinella spiralis TaxID=6334 RepID=A0A0V1B4I3_TRISP|nr:Cell cycle checkpoint control protein RAD9A [Trichinella spiralis]
MQPQLLSEINKKNLIERIFSRALQALSKLPGEDLYLEAKPEGTVNASRSGYACFQFSPKFFISFVRGVDTPISDSSLNRRVAFIDHTSENYCKISMKSAVLTLRALTNAETCEIKIAFAESALKITLHFKYGKYNVKLLFLCILFFANLTFQGIIRKYSLSLIECEAMQSLFDRNTCKNKVVAPCQTLLEAVHRSFQLNQEEVTLSVNDQEMMFRNFVEDEPDPDKVPKTELRLNVAEFLTFDVHMKSELTFTLKEFRALLHFVEYFHVPIVFLFSEPGKPIIFRLENCGDFSAEYVLATLSVQYSSIQITQCSKQNNSTSISENASQEKSVLKNSIEPKPQMASMKSSLAEISISNDSHFITSTRKCASLDTSASILQAADKRESVMGRTLLENGAPPMKKARNLFLNWSQDSILFEECEEQDTVLAPDSDLDDK